MEEIRINLGTIIISVIPMLAKQRRIYLLFPILINKWCRRVKVPRSAREGVEWFRLYLPTSIPSKQSLLRTKKTRKLIKLYPFNIHTDINIAHSVS